MITLQIYTVIALIFISGLCEGKNHKKLHVFAGQEQQSDWSKAFKFCQDKGKNLVTALDKDEHRQMTAAIHECSKKCGRHLTNSWTAANDKDTKDKHFVWQGINKPLTWANWQPGQPDNANNDEHCVVAWFHPNEQRYHQIWLNDRPCKEKNNVICEDW